MSEAANNYYSLSGVQFVGRPTALMQCDNDSKFAFFMSPCDNKGSICVVELWKKTEKRIFRIKYKTEIKIIAVFRIKIK